MVEISNIKSKTSLWSGQFIEMTISISSRLCYVALLTGFMTARLKNITSENLKFKVQHNIIVA